MVLAVLTHQPGIPERTSDLASGQNMMDLNQKMQVGTLKTVIVHQVMS